MYSSTLTREYESGTLVLMLTRGLARSKVMVAKTSLLLILWSAGYFLCFGVTYAYNAFYWDNSVARSLSVAVFNWWLFGVLVVALMMLFSVLSKSYSGVLLGTGGSVLAIYFASLVPRAAKYMPTKLMNGMELLTGVSCTSDFTAAIVVTAAAAAACIALALPLLNKKQI